MAVPPYFLYPERADRSHGAPVSAVLTALAAQAGGLARAGALADAVADLAGVSRRQAQRWIQVALALAPERLEKLPKDEAGTIYRLHRPDQRCEPAVPPELAGVPRCHRRDVALAAVAMATLDGTVDGRDVARKIAELSERPLEWSAAALQGALPHLGGIATVWRTGGWDPQDRLQTLPDVDLASLQPWALAPDLRLPCERSPLQRELRRRGGDRRLRVTAGEADLIVALAGLGGTATPRELADRLNEHSEAVAALAAAQRLSRPAWFAEPRHEARADRRLRLAEWLWP